MLAIFHKILWALPMGIAVILLGAGAAWPKANDWIGEWFAWLWNRMNNPWFVLFLCVFLALYLALLFWSGRQQTAAPKPQHDSGVSKDDFCNSFGEPLFPTESLDEWARLDQMTLGQAACLYVGVSPPSDDSVPDKAVPALEALRQLIYSGELETLAPQLDMAARIAEKFGHIASGTRPNIPSNCRVSVDSLKGLLEPYPNTPDFLKADK